jgi:hypothetical protein
MNGLGSAVIFVRNMLTKFSDFNGDGRTDIDSTGDSLAQLVGAGSTCRECDSRGSRWGADTGAGACLQWDHRICGADRCIGRSGLPGRLWAGFDSVPLGMQRYSGSQMFQVTYAGPQKPGLDQVNILLPAKLPGPGAVSITCWEYPFFIASSSGCLT